jgi:hypothetical protein
MRVTSGKIAPSVFDDSTAERLVREGLSTGQVARQMGYTGSWAVQRWANTRPDMLEALRANSRAHQGRQSKRGMKK